MKAETLNSLLDQLMDDLDDPQSAAEVEAGKYGYRLYYSGEDDFTLVSNTYFARDARDQAVDMAFRESYGDFWAPVYLSGTDREHAREALEIAAHEAEVKFTEYCSCL